MKTQSEDPCGTKTLDFEEICKRIITFREKRDWRQFHDPKNLSQAISIEAAELQEIFLWKDIEASRRLAPDLVQRVAEEAADIFIFMVYLCEALEIDLLQAVEMKIKRNKEKYPVAKAKGNSKKYTEF